MMRLLTRHCFLPAAACQLQRSGHACTALQPTDALTKLWCCLDLAVDDAVPVGPAYNARHHWRCGILTCHAKCSCGCLQVMACCCLHIPAGDLAWTLKPLHRPLHAAGLQLATCQLVSRHLQPLHGPQPLVAPGVVQIPGHVWQATSGERPHIWLCAPHVEVGHGAGRGWW